MIPLLLLLLVLAGYFLGPNPSTPEYAEDLPVLPEITDGLEDSLKASEARHILRPDNEARIVWADSSRQKTPYSIVYLHGFSASQAEGDPVHRNIARHFGMNLYLSRLSEHGIDTSEQLLNLDPEKYWESAQAAMAMGLQLGEKVILMGTSTGGTLALMLAARYGNIAALVLLSPNIEINDPNAWMLNNPWGLQIARAVIGSEYIYSTDERPIYKQYWNYPYRIEGAVALQELLETTMHKETFEQVEEPALLLYYYRDKVHQDSVVRVSAMKEMFAELGTPDSLKRSAAMPLTGNHVIGSYIKSADVEGVEREIRLFLDQLPGIRESRMKN